MYEIFSHSCSTKFPCRGNLSIDINNTENIAKKFIYSSNMPQYLSRNKERELIEIATMLMSKGKGLLSVDESTATMSKYLQPFGLENNDENRRLYRKILFTGSKDLFNYISGVILFHETFYQTDDYGKPFRDILIEKGIILGIKVDKGLVSLAGTSGEYTTQGLDGLAERCIQYYQDGARFAKWRCLVKIGDDRPSEFCLREIGNILGRYASICQQNGLLPILEIEISSEGDYDLKISQFIMEKVLATIYKALNEHHIFLEGTILQTNLVLAGLDCKIKYTSEEIAQATVTAFQRTIPPAVPGICILLPGQSEEKSSIYFNTINQYSSKKPWVLTFNYGRKLLHNHMLNTWNGKKENIRNAQEQLLKQMQTYSITARGEYIEIDRSFLETNDNH